MKLVLANWKMYKNLEEINSFEKEFKKNLKNVDSPCSHGVAVPSIYLIQAKKIFNEQTKIYAQDVFFKKEGAYTGNISYSMLLDTGICGSIIGHSERRQMFNETDETVNLKTISLVENNLEAIVCVGETLKEYESGKSFEVVFNQTINALKNVSSKHLSKIVLAYEPVWAIGTGKVANAIDINQMIKKLRTKLNSIIGELQSKNLKILYGGSVKSENADEFFKQENIDGALVGSAALNPIEFVKLIEIGGKY